MTADRNFIAENKINDAIGDIFNILTFGGEYVWTDWERKFAWFPIVHNDWSITWLKWYKVRHYIYHPKSIFNNPRVPITEYLIEDISVNRYYITVMSLCVIAIVIVLAFVDFIDGNLCKY